MVRGSCRFGTKGCGAARLAGVADPSAGRCAAQRRTGAWGSTERLVEWQYQVAPFGSYPAQRSAEHDPRYAGARLESQSAPAGRAASASRPRSSSAATLIGISLVLLYLVFGENFVDRFMPTGRPTTYELVAGALAWTFALTAPAGFGLVGVARLVTAYDRWRARRPRVTPAVRLRRAIGDDHIVATGDPAARWQPRRAGDGRRSVRRRDRRGAAAARRGHVARRSQLGGQRRQRPDPHHREPARPRGPRRRARPRAGSRRTTRITSSRSTPPSSAPIRAWSGPRRSRSSSRRRSRVAVTRSRPRSRST